MQRFATAHQEAQHRATRHLERLLAGKRQLVPVPLVVGVGEGASEASLLWLWLWLWLIESVEGGIHCLSHGRQHVHLRVGYFVLLVFR